MLVVVVAPGRFSPSDRGSGATLLIVGPLSIFFSASYPNLVFLKWERVGGWRYSSPFFFPCGHCFLFPLWEGEIAPPPFFISPIFLSSPRPMPARNSASNSGRI